MKRLICILLVVFSFSALRAQDRFANYPLPQNPDTLKILAIGNSFSDDGTEYLPALIKHAGITNVIVGRLYIGGCTLQRHCKEYNEGLKDYRYDVSKDGKWVTVKKNATILDGIKYTDWDIITMQEASGISGIYDNYRQWLPQLIDIVRKEALNPKATIVWHQTWAYATNSVHGEFPNYDKNQEKMHNAIQNCVDNLQKDFNIDVVIPSGVAVKLARETRLNNDRIADPESKVYQLTRDGFHMGHQHGRYLTACTWFETLIKPTIGVSVKGNDYSLEDTEYWISKKDARLCQKLASKAVKIAD